MTNLSSIKLYATNEHPCSYLPGKKATTVFIDPNAEVDKQLYSNLSDIGFRRSGGHLYRPHCASCTACIPVRIPVNELMLNRKQRRCLRKNADLDVTFVDNIETDEHYALYEKYIELRHHDGDMYPPSREQFTSFLSNEWGVTRYIEYRKQGTLMGVSVCDELTSGYSAVYTYFDPEEIKRSVGVFAILYLCQHAQKKALPYVYLGYWIEACRKMNYKTDYQPLEAYIEEKWGPLNPSNF